MKIQQSVVMIMMMKNKKATIHKFHWIDVKIVLLLFDVRWKELGLIAYYNIEWMDDVVFFSKTFLFLHHRRRKNKQNKQSNDGHSWRTERIPKREREKKKERSTMRRSMSFPTCFTYTLNLILVHDWYVLPAVLTCWYDVESRIQCLDVCALSAPTDWRNTSSTYGTMRDVNPRRFWYILVV